MTAGVVLAFVFLVAWAPLFLLRTESVREAFPLYRPDERITSVLARLVVTLHMTLGCTLTSLAVTLPPVRTVVGAGAFFAGVGFWLWGRAAISPWRTRRTPDRPPPRLRSDGPFSLVRHPLYFGLLLSSAGLVLVSGRPILLVTLVLCIVVLDARARQEEQRLRDQLGAPYDTYCRSVKRLIPFVW